MIYQFKLRIYESCFYQSLSPIFLSFEQVKKENNFIFVQRIFFDQCNFFLIFEQLKKVIFVKKMVKTGFVEL